MFASDRDLLALEPELFRDVSWAGQRLVKGVGDVSGTTLSLTSQDNTFVAAGVGAGNVVLVDGVSYEVVARLSATTATISRIRADREGAVIPPTPGTGKPVEVRTFAVQIRSAHSAILRRLGIVEDGEGLTESAILNPGSFREVEAMGAVNAVLNAAAQGTAGSAASVHLNRSRYWRERYDETLRDIGAQIDIDGDGRADGTRYVGFAMPVRG